MIGATVSWGGKEFLIKDILPYDGWFDWEPIFSIWGLPYTFTKPGEGYYDMEHGGIWVPGTPIEINSIAIILPLSPEDLKYDIGGFYTRQDIKIYIKCPEGGFKIYLATRIGESA